MEDYFPLAEQFTTQSEPEYCGPASLIMALNALNIDPNKKWKGIWRWFTEEVLHCVSVEKMKQGLTLEELTLMARCNGLHTQTYRPISSENDPKFKVISHDILEHQHSDHTHAEQGPCNHGRKGLSHADLVHHNTSTAYIKRLDFEFFQNIIRTASRREGMFVIANLGRKVLGQTGDGHFAPIGGYHKQSERVLLFDTARFKYPPHWVTLENLYESISTVDKETKLKRGILVVNKKKRRNQMNTSKICLIPMDHQSIKRVSQLFCQELRPYLYKQYLEEQGMIHDNFDSKLLFLIDKFYQEEMQQILYVYMNQMINNYANEHFPNFEITRYYISQMHDDLINNIRQTDVYFILKQRKERIKQTKLYKMIDFQLIDFGLEILTLLFYSLPKQVLFQFRQMSEDNNEHAEFWNMIIEKQYLPDNVEQEIGVLRYHLGIHDEFCHLQDLDNRQLHSFFRGSKES